MQLPTEMEHYKSDIEDHEYQIKRYQRFNLKPNRENMGSVSKSRRLSDISACAWIAPPSNSPLYHDLRAVLGSIGVQDFKISFRGGSLSTVVNILSGSDALTVLPYSVVFMLKRQHTLSALPIRIGDPDRSLGILSRQPQSPATTRLSNYITTAFATLRQLIQRQEQNELWGR